jgi:hypothetical protein
MWRMAVGRILLHHGLSFCEHILLIAEKQFLPHASILSPSSKIWKSFVSVDSFSIVHALMFNLHQNSTQNFLNLLIEFCAK